KWLAAADLHPRQRAEPARRLASHLDLDAMLLDRALPGWDRDPEDGWLHRDRQRREVPDVDAAPPGRLVEPRMGRAAAERRHAPEESADVVAVSGHVGEGLGSRR